MSAQPKPDTGGFAVKQLLEYVVQHLVDEPEDVNIHEVGGERSVVLELNVNEADLGRVIGRRGRVAQALRTLVKAGAVRDGRLVHVEIIDTPAV